MIEAIEHYILIPVQMTWTLLQVSCEKNSCVHFLASFSGDLDHWVECMFPQAVEDIADIFHLITV